MILTVIRDELDNTKKLMIGSVSMTEVMLNVGQDMVFFNKFVEVGEDDRFCDLAERAEKADGAVV